MPYLTNIGPRHDTMCGLGSRGYHIFRRGKIVSKTSGQVKQIAGKKMKVYWISRRKEKVKCDTERAAKYYFQNKLRELDRKGYKRLGIGVKILPPKKSA